MNPEFQGASHPGAQRLANISQRRMSNQERDYHCMLGTMNTGICIHTMRCSGFDLHFIPPHEWVGSIARCDQSVRMFGSQDACRAFWREAAARCCT